MEKYHKIKTVFKRDPETKYKTLTNDYSTPEFEYLQNNNWIFTEKVDGTNIRIHWDGESIKIGGRTDNAQIHTSLFDTLLALFPVDKFQKNYPDLQMTLYGEGYGPKIQKGGSYSQIHNFVLFDIMINNWWLDRNNMDDIAEILEINVVPIVGSGTLPGMVAMAQKGFKSNWGDFIAEGIVARPSIELTTRNGDRIITKIKHKDFGGVK